MSTCRWCTCSVQRKLVSRSFAWSSVVAIVFCCRRRCCVFVRVFFFRERGVVVVARRPGVFVRVCFFFDRVARRRRCRDVCGVVNAMGPNWIFWLGVCSGPCWARRLDPLLDPLLTGFRKRLVSNGEPITKRSLLGQIGPGLLFGSPTAISWGYNVAVAAVSLESLSEFVCGCGAVALQLFTFS